MGLLQIALEKFPASLVASRLAISRLLVPENDTSTGSLETPDAPRSLAQEAKKLCTTLTGSAFPLWGDHQDRDASPNLIGFTHPR
ncbi:MAG: hypothetical protein HC862_28895 [Scytonema sp. RU_4_4]|nr:hypothetical protein [Scytonema sp. RU_4_4]